MCSNRFVDTCQSDGVGGALKSFCSALPLWQLKDFFVFLLIQIQIQTTLFIPQVPQFTSFRRLNKETNRIAAGTNTSATRDQQTSQSQMEILCILSTSAEMIDCPFGFLDYMFLQNGARVFLLVLTIWLRLSLPNGPTDQPGG